jgi:hypothetical protein
VQVRGEGRHVGAPPVLPRRGGFDVVLDCSIRTWVSPGKLENKGSCGSLEEVLDRPSYGLVAMMGDFAVV